MKKQADDLTLTDKILIGCIVSKLDEGYSPITLALLVMRLAEIVDKKTKEKKK